MPIVQTYDSWGCDDQNRTFAFDTKTADSIPLCFKKPGEAKKKVSYHHNADVENHHFGAQHPMKPWRITLTNQLVLGYGLHRHMDCYSTRPASEDQLRDFHSDDYLEFLKCVTPENESSFREVFSRFNIGDDCPIFSDLYNFCTYYSGASLSAASTLISGASDIAINWSGGLHHAKKAEASGFCYINDIVLAILQLLRYHPRVLYIDIDVHHGDGVEQAFWSTDRVMTLSFHKYDGMFFPTTGNIDSVGDGKGKHYALNVPLRDGIDDDNYVSLFRTITEAVMATYRPTAIVLQCGADSLGGDRLGCFNLNIKGHGACVDFIKTFNIPLLIVGGGGYTPRNVSRLWCYETGILNGMELQNELPAREPWRDYFKPEPKLHTKLDGNRFDNKNNRKYLENLKQKIFEQLRFLNGAPSVQMGEIPPSLEILNISSRTNDEDDEAKMSEDEGLEEGISFES